MTLLGKRDGDNADYLEVAEARACAQYERGVTHSL